MYFIKQLCLTEERVYMGTGGAAINILDMETGQTLESTLRDLYFWEGL